MAEEIKEQKLKEEKLSLLEKLSIIQTELKCGKNLKNNFANFKYRSCEVILEALKPYLKQYGLVVKLNDTIKIVGERYYIEAEAKLIDVKSGESIANTSAAREERERKGMDASQITGSCSSYARKYALSGLLALDDGKDADSMAPDYDEEPIDEKLLKECESKDLEALKDEIRTIVELMSETDPNLEEYQKIAYRVIGKNYTSFKVGDCTEENKSILVNILARLKQRNK